MHANYSQFTGIQYPLNKLHMGSDSYGKSLQNVQGSAVSMTGAAVARRGP